MPTALVFFISTACLINTVSVSVASQCVYSHVAKQFIGELNAKRRGIQRMKPEARAVEY